MIIAAAEKGGKMMADNNSLFPELKPCPFCGGEAEFLIQSHSASGNDRGWLFGIRCKKCNVMTPKRNFELVARLCEDGQIHITKDEREKCVDIWNGRVDNA